MQPTGGGRENQNETRLKREVSALIKSFTVSSHLGVIHVAQHIPMNAGLVLAAGLRVAMPERQVDGTAHFLIE